MSWETRTCPVCDTTGRDVKENYGTGDAHVHSWLLWHMRERHGVKVECCLLCGKGQGKGIWLWQRMTDHYLEKHPHEYGKPFEKAVALAVMGAN